MNRLQEDKMYMEIAQVVAKQSYCEKRKVGAVIVKGNTIIGLGYNGTPSGRDNCCEIDGNTKPEVLHAESNAIAKVACSTLSSEGSTLYVTCSPCMECAKLIIQSKICRIVYLEKYRDTSGLDLLRDCGIEVDELTEDATDKGIVTFRDIKQKDSKLTTRKAIEATVYNYLIDNLDPLRAIYFANHIGYDNIKDMELQTQLGLDSLDLVELQMNLEKEFNILPIEVDIDIIKTPKDIVDLIEQYVC